MSIGAGRSVSDHHGFSKSGRYEHIDALRAFAVMLVVVQHTNVGRIPGGSGVTIFFTISGFIITHLLLTEKAKTDKFSIRGFYWRRFLKLAPPFMVIITIPTIIYSLWEPINWSALAAQIFFVFNWNQYLPISPVAILPGSSVVWSLSVEEQFYIGFAILWLLIVKRRHYLGLLTLLALVSAVGSLVLRILYTLNGTSWDRIYTGTDTRLDAIAIGILAATIYYQINRPGLSRIRHLLSHDSIPFAAVAAYLLSLLIRDQFFRSTFLYSMQALATAAMILYGLLASNTTVHRALARLAGLAVVQVIGWSSYSIYLIHAPLMRLMEPQISGLPQLVRVSVLILVGASGGILVWAIVERPVQRWKRRQKLKKLDLDVRLSPTVVSMEDDGIRRT